MEGRNAFASVVFVLLLLLLGRNPGASAFESRVTVCLPTFESSWDVKLGFKLSKISKFSDLGCCIDESKRDGVVPSPLQRTRPGNAPSPLLIVTLVYWTSNKPIQAGKRRSKRKWSLSQVPYYANSSASFNIDISAGILVCGDVHPHPGPIVDNARRKDKCNDCGRTIAKNHSFVSCGSCNNHWHLKCVGLCNKRTYDDWICTTCALPNFSDSFFSGGSPNSTFDGSTKGDQQVIDMELSKTLEKYSKNLKIGHININSVGGFKFFELKTFILQGLFDIMIVSETKVDHGYPDSHFYIKGYRLYRKDRNRHGGGLFIYIRRELIVTRVNDLEGDKVESITLSVQTSRSTKKLLIIGAYRPPNIPKNTWVPELNNILLRASQRFDGFMLIGDLNCDLSHPDKGTKDGQALIDLADVYCLTSLIKTPTRVTADSSSLIDVVLTNKPRSVVTSGAFDLGLSDHHFVYTILRSYCPRSSPRTVIKRRFKHYDPELFSSDVSMAPFHVAHIFDDLDDVCWAWGKLLSSVLDVHAPIKQSTIKREHVPFMKPELLRAIRHRNKLRRQYFKTKDPGDLENYRVQRNYTSSLRRKLISSYLRTKAGDAKGDPKQFWRTIKPFMHCKRNNSSEAIHLKEDGVLITDKREVAEIFNGYYSLVQNVSEVPFVEDFRHHPSIKAIKEKCPVIEQFQFRHVTAAELTIILKSLDPNKATGHDHIPARALRDCASVLATPLSALINTIIDSACVPADWKLAEISPIFKRDDEFDKSKYRPVSILVLLDKVFERCLDRQLQQHFSSILSKFLSAYRKGYSCEAVLLRLIEDWRRSLDNKCVVGAVVMDLSKAFDVIPHDLLLAKLAAYGVSPHSLKLLESYLHDRRQCVRIGHVKSEVSVISRGVPQGSVLGPLLFNIFLNDLFYFIEEANLSNYADDNQLYFSDVDPATVERVLNKELTVACDWFRNNTMVLNPEKCKALVLSGNRNVELSLYADGELIPRVHQVELLGVVVDDSLYFSQHITKLSKKVGKQLDVLCRLRNVLCFSSKLCLYNSFVMSYFSYCSSIWHNCLKSDTDKLDKLHERALRYIYNDQSSNFSALTKRIGYTLSDRRIQDILIIVFKCLINCAPEYLRDMFCIRHNIKNLRGINKLVIPKANSTRFGLKSLRYTTAKVWNSLPDTMRTLTSAEAFRQAMRGLIFNSEFLMINS